jgi:hypothetical protein
MSSVMITPDLDGGLSDGGHQVGADRWDTTTSATCANTRAFCFTESPVAHSRIEGLEAFEELQDEAAM